MNKTECESAQLCAKTVVNNLRITQRKREIRVEQNLYLI